MKVGTVTFDTPAIMGVLNVTPDSFYDGGQFIAPDDALRQSERMAIDGADIIDVGGESTRPGANDVGEQEELDRVIPVIERITASLDVPVSIDTSKAAVMQAAVNAGACMINDVRALRAEGALETAASLDASVCLMHMQGAPRSMQDEPHYDDVTHEVCAFLARRVDKCFTAGISRERIVVDPGFGFGKNVQHNIELLANLRQLRSIGVPVLAGCSRKSTLGALTGRKVDERLAASLAAVVIAVTNGADIVRVHDVAETSDALKLLSAVSRQGIQE